jgi:flavin-dependent dehydrogenase
MRAIVQALVIGGGIAGGAVAAHLARAGRKVILIERKGSPQDKVCGEFISYEAVRYLRGLGIDLAALGAVPISAVNIYTSRAAVGSQLPFPAVSVSRMALDEAILREASACGADLLRGHAARSLRPLGDGWVAELDDGGMVLAADAFLATGKHDLRGWRRRPGWQNDLIGFKMHWRVTKARIATLNSCVELFLFHGGYAGLELVENGLANLCLVVRRRRFAELENRWDLLLAALRAELLPLHQMLVDAEPCSDRPLAIASIPYGLVQSSSNGPWHLGDQAAVIPSFCGEGIAVALHSARMAAEYYMMGKSASDFQTDLASDLAKQVCGATLLSQMLVRPAGQTTAMAIAQLVPCLISQIASGTRIPSGRLTAANVRMKPRLARAGRLIANGNPQNRGIPI